MTNTKAKRTGNTEGWGTGVGADADNPVPSFQQFIGKRSSQGGLAHTGGTKQQDALVDSGQFVCEGRRIKGFPGTHTGVVQFLINC